MNLPSTSVGLYPLGRGGIVKQGGDATTLAVERLL